MAAKVFVYGTLKRGEPNHHWFQKSSGYYKLLCEAKTLLKFPLVIATKYNVPFLLQNPGLGHQVQGELYEVDEKVFQDLDVLEDHPKFYVREEQDVISLENGAEFKAWIYFIKNFKDDLLKQKMYERYTSDNSDNLKYISRYLRDPAYNPRDEIFKNDVL